MHDQDHGSGAVIPAFAPLIWARDRRKTESQTYVQFMLGVFRQFIQGLRSLW
jgi:hypothetical protein